VLLQGFHTTATVTQATSLPTTIIPVKVYDKYKVQATGLLATVIPLKVPVCDKMTIIPVKVYDKDKVKIFFPNATDKLSEKLTAIRMDVTRLTQVNSAFYLSWTVKLGCRSE